MVSQEVGYDGAKQIKGRKRFTLVDTFGLLIMVKVMAASVPEREGAKKVFEKMKENPEKYSRLIRIFVDKEFSGQGLSTIELSVGFRIITIFTCLTKSILKNLPKAIAVRKFSLEIVISCFL